MVKKKVSKKKTSSSSHKTKKHITHTKPMVEKVEIAPIIEQKPVQTSVAKVETPVQAEKINVAPTPIFKDEKIEIQEPVYHDQSNIVKIFAILLCCIVVLFWIGLAIMSTEYNSGPKIIQKNVSITKYVHTPVSLAKLMNISDIKVSERIIQSGYLSQERTDKDFIKKYIVDDRGNKIELIFRGIEDKYGNLFFTGLTSKELYNVSGIYRFEINRYIIEVDGITQIPNELKQVTIWSVENISTDDVKGWTFDISRGVNKIVKFV